ncbi:cytochrome b/b6 domain-containing protein [Desulfoprunum benzoelyticum]|uniref:Cytochrome b n=1 Tax=Desulfoprunum benzoelyticum TaxID=1506996 RepID=A0A840V5U4_9BACT|nr:cytochrome b/b6 domain-containing protein [Desulfoprunum benzoelyticum]MBB5348421.1 cytochrome b [Desulfoprunum benzoelyticum]MBM9528721.1 cytochrome b/b6 domain-containing protein [Desulfoprunum benzoelyticum]
MNEKKQVVVWDSFIRVFHWSLLLLFFVAYLTGDDKGPLHRYVGYAVLLLVIARIFWGFWGTKHALFSDFICSPAKGLNYLKELVTGKPTHYIGHNPAAAWMILLLLASSIIVCLTGYAAHTTKRGLNSIGSGNTISIVGNAYADDDKNERHEDKHKERERHSDRENDDESDSVWSDIHEISAQFMLILICLHIVGVAVSSKVHNENLVKGIITGKKDITTE